MTTDGTLLLKRQDVADLLTVEECIAAVEHAFKLYGEGGTAKPGMLSVHAPGGAFHLKAGVLNLARHYFVVKCNANFFQNHERFGLPNIQGVILLCDAENGQPLALMDSIEITIRRTGAATAVAAKYLARQGATVATICGCGNQGRISLQTLLQVRPLERVFAYDVDASKAARFASELSEQFNVAVEHASDLAAAVGQSDIVVTCTPSKEYFLHREYVAPGTFIAAVGADNEDKQELEPSLLAASQKVVADILDQCAVVGELHHALEKGLLQRSDVHAELGEVVAGKKSGRSSDEEIIIFDSTGMALQDAAAAAIIYEKALNYGTREGFKFA
ncbi:MAG TPA: ornithine cyclodeaminase family protein [Pyrinomonadaceae bacterium]|nr:ornithine cyclodeaminase family protein [Pyrinomonadaceae bacterium]